MIFFKLFFFRDRVSLCSSGCPGTHSVDQAGLELRNLPASASRVIKGMHHHCPGKLFFFFFNYVYVCFACLVRACSTLRGQKGMSDTLELELR
jgi:hypothetical protein